MQYPFTTKNKVLLFMVYLIISLTALSVTYNIPAFGQDKMVYDEWVESDSPQQVPKPSSPLDSVRLKITELVEGGKIPSISVAVAQSGKIIWEESFGWANREKMIKATPHTMYSLASISKPVTATGIMLLVEQGKIDLQSPVNKYISPSSLKAYEGKSDDIKVKHLLHHSSGLPLHWNFFYEDEPYRKPSMEESIRRYGISVHPPGEVYQYSNFGYGILGHIISKVSAKSFANFMKNEVFLPLGMTHSSLDIGPGLEEYAATRYDQDNNPIPFYDFDHEGASAFYCSTHDLVRFGMFHLKNRLPGQKQILKDSTLDLMHKDKDPDIPIEDNEFYAMGWANNMDENGYHIVYHDGEMSGASTILYLVPSENIVVVVLLNCTDNIVYSICEDILCAMLPKYKENLEKNKKSEEAKPEKSKPESEPKLLGEWEGTVKTYEGEIPASMLFQKDGDIFVTLETSRLDAVCPKKLNRVTYKDGRLLGIFSGTIPTSDAKLHPHFVVLDVCLSKNRLVGSVSAVSSEKRDYMALSSYISLKKKK